MPEPQESANVLLTKSVWLPFTTWVVTTAITRLGLDMAPEDSMALASALAGIVVVVVRRYTHRPAHFKKGTGDGNV